MKKITLYLLIVGFFFFSQLLIAQIHVDENGSVGVGTDTPEISTKLKITTDGLTNNQDNKILYVKYTGSTASRNHYGIYTDIVPSSTGYGYGGYLKGGRVGLYSITDAVGSSYRYGAISIGKNGANNYGLYALGDSDNSGSVNYGIYTRGLGTGVVNYGIYSHASEAIEANYAGYFSGNVVVTGNFSNPSDEKLKEDIVEISSAIENIKLLKTKSYYYKKDQKITLSSGKKYGFLAQDVEKIFPEIVSEVVQPVIDDSEVIDPNSELSMNEKQTEIIKYKSINYMQIIPLLTKAIQEQQEMIEDLQNRIEKLEKK